jgi:hypothetical protein
MKLFKSFNRVAPFNRCRSVQPLRFVFKEVFNCLRNGLNGLNKAQRLNDWNRKTIRCQVS